MQRWWFLDNSCKLTVNPPVVPVVSPVEKVEEAEKLRSWTFRVFVAQELLPFEAVAVVGETCTLGKWNPMHCVPMTKDDGDNNQWSVSVVVPDETHISYRYFIYSKDPCTTHMHIRRWETHMEPRQIPAFAEGPTPVIDTLGEVNGSVKLDSGWLTNETIIQFKFFNNPFHFKQKLKNRLIYVKMTPLNLRMTDNGVAQLATSDDSASNDPVTTNHSCEQNRSYALAEVVTLKHPYPCITGQAQFGQAYHEDDMLLFNVTVTEPDNIAYLIDLFTYSSRQDKDEPPIHLGYHYILPNMLRRSDGELEIPITCATNHRPLGMMNVEFLKITALQNYAQSMHRSYIRYWNKKWSGLEVGHRGSGVSFKDRSTIRENTIASLKQAAACGADMVEFDVQLSKDLVPVIYHDYHVFVSLKKKAQMTDNDMMQLPMKDLTFEQLSNLKVYHAVEGRTGTARFFDEDLAEHQPFPKLSDALDMIDMSVGFNIEVKWSMRLLDGTQELDSSIDRNLYVDRILDVVLDRAGQRRIIFSCFDPDVCTMLRYKQNLYPVMFLTQGVTEKYPPYYDPRCNTIESAVTNAYAMELLGIVAHTEDLLRDPRQINLATDLDLIVFCWGEDNNSSCTIQMLKELGIHGIIYDEMDVLSTKEVKKSIFLVDTDNKSHSQLMRLQALEGVRLGNACNCRELPDVQNAQVLQLLEERTKLSLSTATSAESLFLEDEPEPKCTC